MIRKILIFQSIFLFLLNYFKRIIHERDTFNLHITTSYTTNVYVYSIFLYYVMSS